MTAPAYLKQLIALRNAGKPVEVVVAVGWPSAWLRVWNQNWPHTDRRVILGTPDPHQRYDLSALVGLSVGIWCECDCDHPRAVKIANDASAAGALRVFVWLVHRNAVEWYRAAGSWRAAA